MQGLVCASVEYPTVLHRPIHTDGVARLSRCPGTHGEALARWARAGHLF